MKFVTASLVGWALFSGCGAQNAKTEIAIRDTTITPATSFSKLFLDSANVESFIRQQGLSDTAIIQYNNFYKRRNYQYAWFTEDGIAEHSRSFWNLHNNYINYFGDTALEHKSLHEQIGQLMKEGTTSSIPQEELEQTELQLTKHFFEYSDHAYYGKVDPAELEWHIPRKKVNTIQLLDSFIALRGKNLDKWEPVNVFYNRLQKELVHYYNIRVAGGWNQIPWEKGKKHKPGDSSLVIKQLKHRLQISGNYDPGDTTDFFSDELASAVKNIQKSFGLKENEIIDATLINELNIPVEDRIRQVLINLERMRWVPNPPEGNFLLVNIPEFKLHVFEGIRKAFGIDIVVGKEVHSTVIFTDALKYIVFSPYWNVPTSIVQNEILPAIRRNRNYLAKMNMEQTGRNAGVPVIRQKPGGSNALGKVKFIFPNSYNIYFHDTPSKSLFKEVSRAFSHGCIRLAEPEKLAAYLLRNDQEWNAETINLAMSARKEKWVTLKQPVPVFITYFTAWVDGEGVLQFRKDIYGHDKNLAKHLFE